MKGKFVNVVQNISGRWVVDSDSRDISCAVTARQLFRKTLWAISIRSVLAVATPFAMIVLSASASAADAVQDQSSPTKTDNKIVPLRQSDLEALTSAPDDNVTRALINILAARGMLTQQDADSLIAKLDKQAEDRKGVVDKAAGAVPVTQASKENDGKVRVIYLPESDEKKLRDDVKKDIKNEVLQTAKDENWAAPNSLPQWVKRTTLSGDMRFRFEGDFYDSTNDPNAIDFYTINNGAPLDENGEAFPFLNTVQDRRRERFRTRLALNNETSKVLSVGLSFATGNTSNPVSTNQTYGPGFNKYQFLIDRAYLDYHPFDGFKVQLGRLPNPWISTPIVWDEDLNFDGIASHYEWYTHGFKPFVTAGAFPLESTSADYPSYSPIKGSSRDKWLFGTQLGTQIRFNERATGSFALAYYYFLNVNGKTSSPCDAYSSTVSCDTDNSRALSLQKGNTLFGIRDLSETTGSSTYQYYGLATPFHELAATTHLDIGVSGPLHALVDVEYVNNLAYNKSRIESLNVANNYGTDSSIETGNQGYAIQTLFGYPKIVERGEWNFGLAYRLVETDATLDALTDSDFHLGGTNAKGYILGGSLGMTHNAWLTMRYSSSDEVTGTAFALDVLQLDLNARF